jgi:hypothetical protein
MWQVDLTAHTGDTHSVRIYSDDALDLIDNKHFRWSMLDTLMGKGLLRRVEVSYKPNRTGVPRVRRQGKCFFFLVDDDIVSGPHDSHSQAWKAGTETMRNA